MKYRAEIDGLRAVAVIPVILFHAGFTTFSGGFIGVDVFFVISGYLITSIIIEDIEKQRFSIQRFYERRARRILPALFTVLFCCLPFAWLWMFPNQLRDFSESVTAASLFFSNIHFYHESGYFATAAEEKPLLHTWSLAVEEQFYLFFPLLLLFMWRFGRNRAFWLVVVLACISLTLSEIRSHHNPSKNFFLLATRLWELFSGAIAAFIVQKRGVQRNDILALLGLVAIGCAIFVFDESTRFPSLWALVPILGVVFIILFATEDTRVARLLSSKPLVGIGLISYSAYLWHQPLFAFARIRLIQEPSKVLMLALSLVALLLAVLSWRWVEQPFRNRQKISWSRAKLFSFSLLGLLLFAFLGAYGDHREGFESRFSNVLQGDVGHLKYHKYLDERYYDCEPEKLFKQALEWEGHARCKQSKPGKPNVVLLGDSHAEHLFLGLAENFPEANVVFYIFVGRPYPDSPSFADVYNELLDNDWHQTVILSMHYFYVLKGNNDLYEGFAKAIRTLQNVGHRVILVGDIPRFDLDSQYCVYQAGDGRTSRLCKMSLVQAEQQKQSYEDTLKKLSKEYQVEYFAISEPLCDSKQCSMVNNNQVLYRDNNHLNIPGSRLIGDYLSSLLQAKNINLNQSLN